MSLLNWNIKKLCVSISIAALSLSCTAFAAIDNADYDRATYMAEVSGTAQKNQPVALNVKRAGVLVYEDQINANEDGTWRFSFDASNDTACDYAITVSEYGVKKPYSATLKFFGKSDSAISAVNTASTNGSASDMKKALTVNKDVLFDADSNIYKALTDEADKLDNVYTKLASGKQYTTKDLTDAASTYLALLRIANAKDEKTLDEALENNKNELALVDSSVYATYKAIEDEELKSAIVSEFAGKDFADLDTFKTAFNKEVLVRSAKAANGWEDMKKLVSDNAKVIGITIDSQADEFEVYSYMLTCPYTELSDIVTAYDDGVKESKKPGGGNGSTGTTGTGGNTASGNSNPLVVVPTPEKEYVSYMKLTDISDIAWAKDHIQKLYEQGIVSGTGDGRFLPGKNVTREEFVKMIIEAFGLYDQSAQVSFNDVDESKWYYGYVASAVKNNIINGVSSTSFGAGQNITRQDMVAIVYRAVQATGKVNLNGDIAINFGDEASIADYAKEGVQKLVASGIINGMGGNFMPHSTATRAQAAVVISRLLDLQ